MSNERRDPEREVVRKGELPTKKQLSREREGVTTRDLIDKSSWPVGPWSSEPDEVEWVDEISGYKCLVKRNPMFGSLCGYVGIPADHALHAMYPTDRIEMLHESVELHEHFGAMALLIEGLSDEPRGTVPISLAFKVHGNVTFSGQWEGHEEWFFGFDAGHGEDLSPGTGRMLGSAYQLLLDMGCIYRDVDYMMEECRSLAEHLMRRA